MRKFRMWFWRRILRLPLALFRGGGGGNTIHCPCCYQQVPGVVPNFTWGLVEHERARCSSCGQGFIGVTTWGAKP